jgi:hypothetical protein
MTMSNSSVHRILNPPDGAAGSPQDSDRLQPLHDKEGTSQARPVEHQANVTRQTLGLQMLSLPNRSRPVNLIQPEQISRPRQSLEESIPAPMMDPSASPVVQIQPWSNTALSPVFAHHSPGIQARLNSQGRISPIDASRLSNHPYIKIKPAMNSASSSRRGSYQSSCLSPSDSEKNANRTAPPPSAGLMNSPRRKRRPDFPSSPRPIVGRDGDDYVMDTQDYTQTPSILRVPFTPMPPGMQPHSPYHQMGPQSARDPYAVPGSALPTSSVRDDQGEGSIRSSRHAHANALHKSRPKTESIPRSYVLKSLNYLAPHFWNRPGTADCRISEFQSTA